MIRRLIVPLTVAVVALHAGQGFAQGAFPAPLPGQAAAPANDSAFAPVNGAAPVTSFGSSPASFLSGGVGAAEDCMKGFMPLREEAEQRGKLIKAASYRHASADEACKLIGNFGQAEIKMIKYVETHSAQCGITPQMSDQLKNGHKNTETMLRKICAVAQQAPVGPSLSDVLGSSTRQREPSLPMGDYWTEKRL
jgi:hypothetical protein